MLSKSELLSFGMKPGWIEAVFDAPDEVGPSGHWLNKSGEPLYDIARVKVACARVGVDFSDLSALDVEGWVVNDRPTSKPLLTFDFHALADFVVPGIARDLRSLRISHPVLGRENGSKEKEYQLIDSSLRAMVKACFQVDLTDGEINHFLSGIAGEGPKNLGLSQVDDIVVRKAKRRSYVSKTTSLSSVKRFLYAMAMIQAGAIRSPSETIVDLRYFLSTSPRIRLDSTAIRIAGRGSVFSSEICERLASKLVEKKHHLFHGELSDAPGRNESWDEYVIYQGKNSWTLLIEATDFSGLSNAPPSIEVMATQELVEWVIDRDDEDKDQAASDEVEKSPRPRFERLAEIAKDVGADECSELLGKWLSRDSMLFGKPRYIEIESVIGVVKRPIWIRIYHSVYEVMTNFGPAYLYPPDLDGSAKLVFKNESSTSMGREIKVSPDLRSILASYSEEFEKLKEKIS